MVKVDIASFFTLQKSKYGVYIRPRIGYYFEVKKCKFYVHISDVNSLSDKTELVFTDANTGMCIYYCRISNNYELGLSPSDELLMVQEAVDKFVEEDALIDEFLALKKQKSYSYMKKAFEKLVSADELVKRFDSSLWNVKSNLGVREKGSRRVEDVELFAEP